MGYLCATVTSLVAALLSTLIGTSSVILLQVMAVLVGSWSGGIYPGLLATTLCIFMNLYYFSEPVGSFEIHKPSDRLSLVLFTIVALSIAVVNELKKRAFDQEDRRRDELQLLMSSIGDGVIATNQEDQIMTLNSMAEGLTGWSQQEALGQPLTQIFRCRQPGNAGPAHLKQNASLTQGMIAGQVQQLVLIAKNQKETVIEVSAAPISRRRGEISGTVLIFRNISARLKAEEQLKNNEERFRALVKATAEIVWTANADGSFVEDSPTWRAFTGQSYEQWQGSGWLNSLHPDDREKARQTWAEAIEDKKSFQMDYRLESTMGGYRWTSVRGVPVLEADGSIREWIGMNVDVTRERMVVESLRSSEKRYELVAEAANDAIWDWDLVTDQVLWNIGLSRLFGYPPQLTTTDADWWYEKIHPEDRQRIEQVIHQATEKGIERWSAEYRFRKLDGSYAFVLNRGRVIYENDRAIRMAGSMLDLTERKQIEQAMSERTLLSDLRADISTCIATAESLQVVLQLCTQAIFQRLQARYSHIWLISEETGQLELAATSGAETSDERQIDTWAREFFPIDQICREKTSRISNNVKEEFLETVGENSALSEICAFAGLPLIVEGKVVGVLAAYCPVQISEAVFKDLAPLAGTIAQYIERKRGEEKLNEQEHQYRRIFEASNDAILIFDAEGIVVEANPFACKMHGYSYEELIGKSGMEIIEARDLPKFSKFLERVHSGKSFFDQGIHLRKDGTQVYVDVQGSALQYRGKRHLLAVVRDITERRLAEKQFLELTQESERQRRLYDTILSNTVDQVYVLDLEHRFSYANQALLSLWDKTWDEAMGKTPQELGYPADEAQRQSQEIEQVVHSKRPLRGEISFTGGNGRRVFDYIFFPVLGVDGEVEAVAGTSRDVTDRRITEDNLRQSESRFRQLADVMPQIVWTATPNGYIDYYNKRWYEFTGFGTDQRGDTCWTLILHPEDLRRWQDSWQISVETGTTCEIEYRLYDRSSNSYQWYLGRAVSVKGENGEVVRWFGTCTDINRQKRNELISDFLADASARLVELISDENTMEDVAKIAVPDFADWCAIDLLEKDGHGRRVALVHSELTNGELSSDVNEIYPPAFDANSILWKTWSTGAAQLIEQLPNAVLNTAQQNSESQRAKQNRWLRSCLCVPLISRGRMLGAITFAMASSGRHFDLDDLHAAEDVASRFTVALENTILYQQLRESDRRKDEFLAMLAHELRNPLAPIRSGLDLLSLEFRERQPVLLVMKEQVEHLVRLVDDLLDVSRIMRGKIDLRKSIVNLQDILDRAIDSAKWGFQEKQQTFTADIPEQEIPVNADPVRLVQVVNNLLNNASKYTDHGGRIELKVETAEGQVYIHVVDNGIGIEQELLCNVFDLFTQSSRALDRAQGGLGIGLTLVKNLVEMHEGKVFVFSDGPETGSEFLVQLPVSPRPVPVEEKEPEVQTDKALRILVVDDNLGAAQLLSLLLGKLGPHKIKSAHDGHAALAAIESFHPDLILLDIGLPGMDGYEVASKIREQRAYDQMLLVALTGYGREEDRARSKSAGFDEHLVKPPALEMLKKILQHPRLQENSSNRESDTGSAGD